MAHSDKVRGGRGVVGKEDIFVLEYCCEQWHLELIKFISCRRRSILPLTSGPILKLFWDLPNKTVVHALSSAHSD